MNLQKMGGVAALIQALTWVVAFAVFLGVLFPAGYFEEGMTTAEKVRIIVDNQFALSISYLLPYVLWGILHVVLSLALYERLKAGAPTIAQIATAIGLIWAGLVMAGGFVYILGIRTVVGLYGADPAQAGVVWVAVEIVASAVSGSAGEIPGGVWLLLIGWAALRARELPRALSYFALALGATGLITVVPPHLPAEVVYGLGLIVWFAWAGIVMLRSGPKA
jgi:hypothetical protein